MKFWAYKTQYCDDIVFAADIEADKVARRLVGRCTSPKFYSDGIPGRREIMFQRTNRGGSGGHFYYQSEDSDRQGDGARETLSHALCKRAISELTSTTLRVGSREIPIRILDSSSEKDVVIGENRYRPDVSFRFESDSEYQMKWDGILHVEVWHMHATGEKMRRTSLAADWQCSRFGLPKNCNSTSPKTVLPRGTWSGMWNGLRGCFQDGSEAGC